MGAHPSAGRRPISRSGSLPWSTDCPTELPPDLPDTLRIDGFERSRSDPGPRGEEGRQLAHPLDPAHGGNSPSIIDGAKTDELGMVTKLHHIRYSACLKVHWETAEIHHGPFARQDSCSCVSQRDHGGHTQGSDDDLPRRVTLFRLNRRSAHGPASVRVACLSAHCSVSVSVRRSTPKGHRRIPCEGAAASWLAMG